jgi:hypothetical protein
VYYIVDCAVYCVLRSVLCTVYACSNQHNTLTMKNVRAELAKATAKLSDKAKTVAIVLGDFQVQKEVLENTKGVAVRAQQQVLAGNRVNSNPEDAGAKQVLIICSL